MQTQEMPKDQVFKLRLEERDRARLDAIARRREMSAAHAVRVLLKEEWERTADPHHSMLELAVLQVVTDARGKSVTEEQIVKRVRKEDETWSLMTTETVAAVLQKLIARDDVERSADGYFSTFQPISAKPTTTTRVGAAAPKKVKK